MKKTVLIALMALLVISLLTLLGCTKAKEEKVVCPVMGTEITKDKASDSVVYNGKTYYFCCAGCKPAFEKEPEKYIK